MAVTRREFLVRIAGLYAAGLATFDALGADTLRFGVQGAAAGSTLRALWGPLIEELGSALGRPVEVHFFGDYQSTVEALREGKVQIAWVGNRNAIDAVDHAGCEIFAQVLNAQQVPGYYSLLIAAADSALTELDDVLAARANLSFGLGDTHSTSGTTVPMYFLFARNHITPGDFASYRHANHERNFLDVAERKVDVATISSVMLQRFRDRYPDQAERIKVVWASPLIPTDPLVWRRDLDGDLKTAVKGFFLAYGRQGPGKSGAQVKAEQTRLAATKWAGFQASSNRQLEYVRLLYLFGEREALKADATLDPQERTRRIDAIQAQIDRMEAGEAPSR